MPFFFFFFIQNPLRLNPIYYSWRKIYCRRLQLPRLELQMVIIVLNWPGTAGRNVKNTCLTTQLKLVTATWLLKWTKPILERENTTEEGLHCGKWGFERDSGRRFDQGIADKATLTLQMKNIFYQELIISGGWTSYSTIFQILGKKEIFCNYT